MVGKAGSGGYYGASFTGFWQRHMSQPMAGHPITTPFGAVLLCAAGFSLRLLP